MNIFAGLTSAVIFAIIAVGLVEVVRNFLPTTLSSKVVTLISLGVEVVVAVIGAVLVRNNGFEAIILSIIGTISFSQLFYTAIVSLIKKLTDFLQSKK